MELIQITGILQQIKLLTAKYDAESAVEIKR